MPFWDWCTTSLVKEYLTVVLQSMETLARESENPLSVLKKECPICFEPMDNCIVLWCQHRFHFECIQKWSQSTYNREQTCPYCRQPLQPPVQPPTASCCCFRWTYVYSCLFPIVCMQMWQSFGAKVSVLTSVVEYLSDKEMCKCRQLSKLSKNDIRGWRHRVLRTGTVVDCQKCPALRLSKYTEHCPLCESSVCVDHLERCVKCHEIYCSFCVGFCCL